MAWLPIVVGIIIGYMIYQKRRLAAESDSYANESYQFAEDLMPMKVTSLLKNQIITLIVLTTYRITSCSQPALLMSIVRSMKLLQPVNVHWIV